jgi:hypothetical protein
MSAQIEYFLSMLFTFPGFIATSGMLFLLGSPALGLYFSLHVFKYSWTENGIIAIPHVLQIWLETARAFDHNTLVLVTTVAAAYLVIKYPNAYNLAKRFEYLPSQPYSPLSQSELLEAEQVERVCDRVWEMVKAAIFLNGAIFWHYGLDVFGIR